MQLVLLAFALVDFASIVGGHGYDFDGLSRPEPGDYDEGTAIGTPWILATLFLAVVTVALLVWLSPSRPSATLKATAPKALIVVVIAAPLIGWTASSAGDDESLIVERATGAKGTPELLVSLADKALNTVQTTYGKTVVRLECLGRDGEVVLDAKQRWPFALEPRYDYPHAHQAASREQLRRADRCRLRGTRIRLEADVKGVLAR